MDLGVPDYEDMGMDGGTRRVQNEYFKMFKHLHLWGHTFVKPAFEPGLLFLRNIPVLINVRQYLSIMQLAHNTLFDVPSFIYNIHKHLVML